LLYPDVPSAAPGDAFSGEADKGGLSRLVGVRHGTTAWSRLRRHTGRTDVNLEEAGRREARRVGASLAGHEFALVLSSPMSRAVETCSLAGFGARGELCADLAEWDYGNYEGMTTEQIRSRRPGWDLWRDGVEGGETLGDVARRADRVIALVRSAGGDALVFSHGHFLRVLCVRWLGLAPARGSHFTLDPGALGVLGWEREVPALLRWNFPAGQPLT
jgi:broad specificity phosphatase PhoE